MLKLKFNEVNKMNSIEIRKVSINEWKELKEIRGKALEESPESFSLEPFESNNVSDDKWIELVKRAYDEIGNFQLFLIVDGEIAGCAGGVWDTYVRTVHTGSLIWLYVLPQYRRKGFAELLVKDVIKRLKDKNKAKIKLLVTSTNKNAISLYEKLGFQKIGTLRQEMKIGSTYYDEDIMEMPI